MYIATVCMNIGVFAGYTLSTLSLCSLTNNYLLQVLYEYAFSSCTEPIGKPFGIVQVIPRREIPLSKTLTIHDAGLTSSQLLLVELQDDAADPLDYLGSPEQVNSLHRLMHAWNQSCE